MEMTPLGGRRRRRAGGAADIGGGFAVADITGGRAATAFDDFLLVIDIGLGGAVGTRRAGQRHLLVLVAAHRRRRFAQGIEGLGAGVRHFKAQHRFVAHRFHRILHARRYLHHKALVGDEGPLSLDRHAHLARLHKPEGQAVDPELRFGFLARRHLDVAAGQAVGIAHHQFVPAFVTGMLALQVGHPH